LDLWAEEARLDLWAEEARLNWWAEEATEAEKKEDVEKDDRFDQ
jgi:hypothetical protein